MVWFCVAMMPFCISALTTAATRSAMRLASSLTMMASGMRTSRMIFSRGSFDPRCLRFSRSWRRFIAAIERCRPSSPVAWLIVSLPERRRSSPPPLPLGRRSSCWRSGWRDLAPPVGLPASARAAAAWAAAGSTSGSAAFSLAGLGFFAVSSRAFSASARSFSSASLRCRAISRSRSSCSSRSFWARSSSISRLRRSSSSRAFWARSASVACAAFRAFRRRSFSVSDRLRCAASPPAAPAAPAFFGTTTRFFLRSTVTDLVRPWLKLWRTWLVSVPPPRRPRVLPLSVLSFVSLIRPYYLSTGSSPDRMTSRMPASITS